MGQLFCVTTNPRAWQASLFVWLTMQSYLRMVKSLANLGQSASNYSAVRPKTGRKGTF